jgi:hypothetical protein
MTARESGEHMTEQDDADRDDAIQAVGERVGEIGIRAHRYMSIGGSVPNFMSSLTPEEVEILAAYTLLRLVRQTEDAIRRAAGESTVN